MKEGEIIWYQNISYNKMVLILLILLIMKEKIYTEHNPKWLQIPGHF